MAILSPPKDDYPGVPTFAEREVMWRSIEFPKKAVLYPGVEECIKELRECLTGGGVEFHSFAIPAHPVFDWYLERNRLHECNFFERFWGTASLSTVLPYKPCALNYYDTAIFQCSTAFHLGADLSGKVFYGGAYTDPTGRSKQARRLGEVAALELLGGDYEETLYYCSDIAWSGFFMDVAWDYTAVVISKPLRLIHVILATDSD